MVPKINVAEVERTRDSLNKYVKKMSENITDLNPIMTQERILEVQTNERIVMDHPDTGRFRENQTIENDTEQTNVNDTQGS